MEIKTINAALCAKMFLGGAKNLEANKEWINELNVFPHPPRKRWLPWRTRKWSLCARQFPPDP